MTDMLATIPRRTQALITLLATAAALAGIGLASAPRADAATGTVLNRFERTCYSSYYCTAYRQTNGAYIGRYGSLCVTKKWPWGSYSYTLPPYTPCR